VAGADGVGTKLKCAKALKRFEMLGVDLFDRQPKGMVPTEAGQLFERRLYRLLEHLRRGDSAARKRAFG